MRKYLIAAVLCFAFGRSHLHAQGDQRTLTTKIADLLARLPAPDAAQADKNMQAMAEMGQPGLLAMSTMLAPQGQSDNTALQYALGGFSYYCAKPGNEGLRAWCADAYCTALEKVADTGNKAFLIRELEIVGNDAMLPYLKLYLSDDRLCDPAARALVRLNTPVAQQALLDALQHASPRTRLTLVEALGDCRSQAAVPGITPFVHSDDRSLRKLALYALARIGDPTSGQALADAAEKSGFGYDEIGATAAYLEYGRRLAATGKTAEAEKVGRLILQKTASSRQVQTRSAALKLLTDLRAEKAVPLLIAAMDDKDPQYRAVALAYAAAFPADAAVVLWLEKLKTAPDPVKAGVLQMLGKTGNRSALPAVLGALRSQDQAVRMAAIPAAEQLGGQDALPALLDVMSKGDPQEVDAVAGAIRLMKGQEVVNRVGDALVSMPAANARVALIGILASRSAVQRLNDVLLLTKNSDPLVSTAAFSALKNMVRQTDLPVLFELLSTRSNMGEITAVQDAIVAATATLSGEDQRVALVVDVMNKDPRKQAIYFGILAGIGGKAAMDELMNRYDGGDDSIKAAAAAALSGSRDKSAASPLLQISRKARREGYFDAVLEGYIRLAAQPGYLVDERLLLLRNAMALARTAAQKQLIFSELGDCKTYPALIFAGRYLDDTAVQHQAAYAVMQIALSNKDWFGQEVRGLLGKAAPLLNGPDAEYHRQAIDKHLAELPAGEGIVTLFNGRDLTGWKGLVANPILRAGMDVKTLDSAQRKADERMLRGWYVKDGELVFSGDGDNLCTKKKYGDFEMWVDWKIGKKGDAGIYLRGSPQVQIWDTSRVDVGAQVGSGGLYNNQVNESKPLTLADNAIGEWNSFHILMIGDRVTVYLNGQLVVNKVMLENYWDRNLPIFPEEQIELQAHGTVVAYRDMYIREIPRPKPFVLSEEEKKEGYKVLFDGTNMHEWTGNTAEYVLEDGNIVMRPRDGSHGNLYSKDEYSNLVLRFEFQLTPGANNGIGLRAPLEGDAAYVGMEIQVLDNEAPIYKDLHAYQYHGSVYGVIPAKRGYLKPVGEWNTEEITARGNRIKVILNGTVILDGDISEASKNGTADGKEHPGLKRTTGHIGFLGHGDVVKFRNVRIRPLP